MTEPSHPPVTQEEAQALAKRLGLSWANADHIDMLARAMTTMNLAGQTVQRVPTKMTQPAHVFRVAGKLPRA